MSNRNLLPTASTPTISPPSTLSGGSQTMPMAIPQSCEASPSIAPPPLPPPRHISELNSGQDSAWQWANAFASSPHRKQGHASVKQGSSLLGARHGERQLTEGAGRLSSRRAHKSAPKKDQTINSESQAGLPKRPDELRSLPSPSDINHSLHSEEQLGQRSLENSSQAYDKQLLSKIGKQTGAVRSQALPSLAQSNKSQEPTPTTTTHYEQANAQLAPLSLPERRFTSVDSPTSWRSSRPSSTAVSPAHPPGLNSVHEKPGVGPRRLSHRTSSGSIAGEDGLSMAKQERAFYLERDTAVTEENGVKDLNINDKSPDSDHTFSTAPKLSLKRKASSPPSDVNRTEKARSGNVESAYSNGQQNQLTVIPNHSGFHAGSSLGSSVSTSDHQNGSYGSSYAISLASSATSLMSGDRSVPHTYSSVPEHDMGPIHSPKAYFSDERYPPELLEERRSSQYNMPIMEQQTAKVRSNGVSRKPGVHICDCCPKKPKKFKTKEELRAHELEKQYTCQYCPNRFKNKNEAERHQNSLHLRRHSWSCAALVNARDVFHLSASPTGSGPPPDACGYCGKEFSSDPVDWVARTEHLNHFHRFGECNQTKKFYRADHFRQHLKHSHAGSSGKWTNMLENACMRVESPLVDRQMGPPTLSSGPPPKLSISVNGFQEEQ